MTKLKVGVLFGGRSAEHEVSVVTALQVISHLDRTKYEVLPIYITKQGKWLVGMKLAQGKAFKKLSEIEQYGAHSFIAPDPTVKQLVAGSGGLFARGLKESIDVAFLSFHGTHGEDGAIQGLLELADIPYTGAGVAGSAVGMDKILMKAAFKAAGIPVVPDVWFNRSEWKENQKAVISRLEKSLRYPMYVKPANTGSSIAVGKAKDRKSFIEAIEVASRFDRRIIVDQGVTDLTEINCSVLGNDNPIPSICEQPLPKDELQSYRDKYLRGGKGKLSKQGMAGLSRKFPAPISKTMTRKIQDLAVKAFKATDCAGIARVDFLIDKKRNEIYVNEINTLPGSFAFYLWEAVGLTFPKLLDRIIELGLERHKDVNQNIRSIDTTILENLPL
jgi:D-alanine-D-alanine ligase